MAKTRHAHRPPAMPVGSPMSSAIAAMVVACHAMAWRTCRRVNPSVFKIARSRRRLRVELASIWASVPAAIRASSPESSTGTLAMVARLTTFAGRSAAAMNGFGRPLMSWEMAVSPASRLTPGAKRTRNGSSPSCAATPGSVRAKPASASAAPSPSCVTSAEQVHLLEAGQVLSGLRKSAGLLK
jgi:hypothetical protein